MFLIEALSNLTAISLALFNAGGDNLDRDGMADYLSSWVIARSMR